MQNLFRNKSNAVYYIFKHVKFHVYNYKYIRMSFLKYSAIYEFYERVMCHKYWSTYRSFNTCIE